MARAKSIQSFDADFLFDDLISEGISAYEGSSELSIIEFAEEFIFNGKNKLYPPQRAILKAFYGEPLKEDEFSILENWKLLDRTTYVPGRSYRNLVWEAGRRCHHEDSLLITTLGTITFKEVLKRFEAGEQIGIYTYDPQTWQKKVTFDIDLGENGTQPCFEVVTRTGRSEKITYNHPYLVWRKEWDKPRWVNASELQLGDPIAVPTELGLFGTDLISLDRAKLLGYLSGDRRVTQNSIRFSNADSRLIEDIKEILCLEFPDIEIKKVSPKCPYDWRLSKKERVGTGIYSSLRQWLKEVKELGTLAKHKRVPQIIKQSPKATIAAYLSRLYACDGWVTVDKPRYQHPQGKVIIGITLASQQFINELQIELCKFGIIASIYKKEINLNDKLFDAWSLEITHTESLITFIQQIGIFGKEDKLLNALQIILEKGESKTPFYQIPLEVWNHIQRERDRKGFQSRDLVEDPINERIRSYYKPCKREAFQHGNKLEDQFLQDIASSDLAWDEVASVESLGEHNTIRLSVPETEVIGNYILSHNSSKSTVVSIIALYEFYKLISLENPSAHYALLPNSPIAIFVIAQSLEQVKETLFAAIKGYALGSDYFKGLEASGKIEFFSEEIRCTSKNVALMAKHTNSKALVGYSIKTLIIDEAARFEYDNLGVSKADEIWENVGNAVSTFGKDGFKIAISSAWEPRDYIEQLYEVAERDPATLGFRLRTWDVNLNPNLSEQTLKSSEAYIKNPTKAALEFEGIRANKQGTYLITENVKKAFTGFSCIDAFQTPIDLMNTEGDRRYYVGVQVTRMESLSNGYSFAHCDYGIKKDSAAFAVCHPIQTEEGKWAIQVDGLLAWKPYSDRNSNNEGIQRTVSFLNVEENLIQICKARRVMRLSFDSFNSQYTIQKLHTIGILTEQMSTSNQMQLLYFSTLKTLIDAGLLILPKDSHWSTTAELELSHLIQIPLTGRIDHQKGGFIGKDLADAIANSVYNCYLHMTKHGLMSALAGGVSTIGAQSRKKVEHYQGIELDRSNVKRLRSMQDRGIF